MRLFQNLFRQKQTGHDPLAMAFEEAIGEFERGDYVSARDHFALLLNAIPNHPLANLLLARTYMKLEDYTQAVNILLNQLEFWPESIEAIILLGMVHYETGHPELAEDRFKEALDLKKDSVLVHENLAITYIHEDRYEEAKEELIKLLEERPDDHEILELLVLVYGKLGDLDSATALLTDKSGKRKNADTCQEK